jgi:hypothetical protein
VQHLGDRRHRPALRQRRGGGCLGRSEQPLAHQVAQALLDLRGIGPHARRHQFSHHLAAVRHEHGLAGGSGAHVLAELVLEGLDADAVHG